MTNSNRLFIGSYVAIRSSGQVIKVSSLTSEKVGYINNGKESFVKYSNITPIPITLSFINNNLLDIVQEGFAEITTEDKSKKIFGYSYNFATNKLTVWNAIKERRIEITAKYVNEFQEHITNCIESLNIKI